MINYFFFFSSRRRHTRYIGDWSSDVCSSDLYGLFDRVVPAADLTAAARTQVGQWIAFPPLAVQRAKESLYVSETASLTAMLDLEIVQQNELFATPEARERIGQSLTRSR